MLENKCPSQVTGRRSFSRPCRSRRRSSKGAKPVEDLKRSFSEPILFTGRKDCVSWRSHSNLQAQTCRGTTFSSPSLLTAYPGSFEGYNGDAKVVITVTVEGSPGPIRVMVKLGFTVEDTIKFVLERYGKEGRMPKLDKYASCYELHRSYFSIQCLDKLKFIGDIGCRTFYLRRSNSSSHSPSEGFASETSQNDGDSPLPLLPSLFMISPLFGRKFAKLERRVRKLWRCFVCLQ